MSIHIRLNMMWPEMAPSSTATSECSACRSPRPVNLPPDRPRPDRQKLLREERGLRRAQRRSRCFQLQFTDLGFMVRYSAGGMPDASDQSLLEALLNSWDRDNTILINLLRALPAGGLDIRAVAGSPSVAELFAHIHYVRLVFVLEDAPEFGKSLPEKEWASDHDRDRIVRRLNESARVVRDAVKGRLEARRDMDLHYDHPILLLQHMIWHKGYHHGQIKLALKATGRAMEDAVAGPVTWGIWMRKSGQ